MKNQEFLEAMQSNCSFLENEGYFLRNVDPSTNRNFWYEKSTLKGSLQMSLGWTQYGDEYQISGLTARKRFNIVEEEIQKVLGGELIDCYTILRSPEIEYISKDLPYSFTENNIHFFL